MAGPRFILAGTMLLSLGMDAQVTSTRSSAATVLPAYDVVSVKLNKTGSSDVEYNTTAAGFSAVNMTLRMLMEYTFEVRGDLIEGVTGVVGSSHFDLEGKVSDPDPAMMKKLSEDDRRTMLAPVLAERFQLRTHRETRELPMYELVPARDGTKLKRVDVEPVADPAQKDSRGLARGDSNWGSTRLTGRAIPMSALAHMLSAILKRTVTDKTGLEGEYDVALRWTPDMAGASDDVTIGSIFTALQEQLGLRLKPAKGAVEKLIVDHAEMPSEN